MKRILAYLACMGLLCVSITKAQAYEEYADPKPGSCEEIIRTHGFLSRGQFQCGFSHYSEDMMNAARDCAHKMSEAERKLWLKRGMEMFDFNEHKRGHAAMCASLLKLFPKILRK